MRVPHTGRREHVLTVACMDATAKAAKRAVLTRAGNQLEPQLRQMEQETDRSLKSCCLFKREVLLRDSNKKIRLSTGSKSLAHAKSRTNLSSAVTKSRVDAPLERARPIHGPCDLDGFVGPGRQVKLRPPRQDDSQEDNIFSRMASIRFDRLEYP